MKAQRAFELSEAKIPSLDDKQYNSIITQIEHSIKIGSRNKYITLVYPPSKSVCERLRGDGYYIVECKCDFFIDTWEVGWDKNNLKKYRKWNYIKYTAFAIPFIIAIVIFLILIS